MYWILNFTQIVQTCLMLYLGSYRSSKFVFPKLFTLLPLKCNVIKCRKFINSTLYIINIVKKIYVLFLIWVLKQTKVFPILVLFKKNLTVFIFRFWFFRIWISPRILSSPTSYQAGVWSTSRSDSSPGGSR